MDIYLTFLKIGGFTLGGGFAMIPLIQDAAKKWATDAEIADFIALGQSLPGVVGINTATAVGRKAAGFRGSVAATAGMVTPSLVIIVLIAAVFDKFMEIELLQRAFMGIRPAVAALIVLAAIRMVKAGVTDVLTGVIAVGAFFAVLATNIPAPAVIAVAGVLGVVRQAAVKKL